MSYMHDINTPARGRPTPLPIRKRWSQTICSYRRGRKHLTCTVVTVRSAPDACRAMEELRKLVALHAPVELRRAA
jgi:hypothetical protein